MGDGVTAWTSLRYYATTAPAVAFTSAATYAVTPAMISSTRTITLGANLTISALPASGTIPSILSGTVTLVLKQPATGGPFSVTWPTILWAEGASAPVMPPAVN